ncbi:MAG: RagB/SusD family nutrient uptake outer membrane protein [Bacteroidales bacterium]
MKKIAFIALASLALSTSSCSDFLDTTTNSEFTTDIVFSNPAYTKLSIMGIYSLMTTDELYSSRLSTMFGYNTDIEVVGADQNSFSQVGNRGLSNYLANPSYSGHLERVWTMLYKGIERANLAIAEIPNSPATTGGTAEEKAAMMGYYGEALTLRSLFYFELVRHWGDVPFKLDPTASDGSNFYLAPTDRDEIMERLIADLEEAEQYVPWVKTGEYTPERVSKGFVKGLAARIALTRGGYSIRNKAGFPTERGSDWRKYYEIANKHTRELQEQGIHKLNPSYLQLFKSLNAWQTETTYSENLFEVAHGYTRSGELGYSVGVRFRTNPKYGFQNNANVVSTSPYYYYMFDRKDLRRDVAVAFYNYSNSTAEQKEVFVNSAYAWCIGKYDIRWMDSKFLSENLEVNAKRGYGINWVVMRYADVLLMLAETENALNNGPTPLAKAALKEVRSRAFDAADQGVKVESYVESLGSEEAFFDAIVDERAYEFGGESIRKYDLIRWNLLGEKIEEQRTAYRAMINAEAPYESLPKYLFVKMEANGEIIDKASINFYDDMGSDEITGTERLQWLSGWGESTKTNALLMITNFSSGLNTPVQNRHLFPIQNSIIAEGGGLLVNGYNF